MMMMMVVLAVVVMMMMIRRYYGSVQKLNKTLLIALRLLSV